jgi:hypothetical protein
LPEEPEVHPRLRELFARVEKLPMPLQEHLASLLESMLKAYKLIEGASRRP